MKNLNSPVLIEELRMASAKPVQTEPEKGGNMDNDDNVTNTEETTANQTTVATETGNGTNDQGSPEVSQNGQDGGNTEEAGEQHYTLDEILKADPAIKAESDRKMQAAIAKHDARLARGNSKGVQQEAGWKQEGKKS